MEKAPDRSPTRLVRPTNQKTFDFDYIDVLENPENLERMLKLSDGRRRVPVIVNGDQVAVGFNDRS